MAVVAALQQADWKSQQALSLAWLGQHYKKQSKGDPSWNFYPTPNGYVGIDEDSGHRMLFTRGLIQIGDYSPTSSWQIEREADNSLVKITTDLKTGGVTRESVNILDLVDGSLYTSAKDRHDALALAGLQSQYGDGWKFSATGQGYIGHEEKGNRQMSFDLQLDQISYSSPDRKWWLQARDDGSLWKISQHRESANDDWSRPEEKEIVLSRWEEERYQRKVQQLERDKQQDNAFYASEQYRIRNEENYAALLNIQERILGASKFALELLGSSNPLVGVSEIATSRTISGDEMHPRDYVQVGASLVPTELVLLIAGKVVKIALGTKARDILAKSLGPSPYPAEAAAQAHHLVGVELFNTPLGQRLTELGIDLNGKENGVWLPKYDFPDRGNIAIHSGRTAKAYTDEVLRRFEVAKPKSKQDALAVLGSIRDDLLSGQLQINKATGAK